MGAPFERVTREVLPGWEISLAFVDGKTAQSLNKKLRGKTYTPNVLSYALGNKSCEIIICPSEAKKQAADFSMNGKDFILYLFIHGVLHIKGWAHGARMEQWERKLLKRYGASYSDGHRHRHVPSKNGRRRGTLR